MNGLRIRIATPQDAPGACEALRRSIRECCTLDHQNDPANIDSWLRNKTPQNVRLWIEGAGNYALVAESEGAIAGFAMLFPSGEIPLFYLIAEARGRGIGRAILDALEVEARRRGLSELTLESTNTARAFYLGNGFELLRTCDIKHGSAGSLMRKRL